MMEIGSDFAGVADVDDVMICVQSCCCCNACACWAAQDMQAAREEILGERTCVRLMLMTRNDVAVDVDVYEHVSCCWGTADCASWCCQNLLVRLWLWCLLLQLQL